MPKVKFRMNIGSIDRSQFTIPDGVDGDVVEVSERMRLLLVERGWAEDVKPAPTTKREEKPHRRPADLPKPEAARAAPKASDKPRG